jgi:DNA-binding NarL/FixJ family response regulator
VGKGLEKNVKNPVVRSGEVDYFAIRMTIPHNNKIKVAIADDHQLVTKSLVALINSFDSCAVVADAINGDDLQRKLGLLKECPDILLVDVNMPVMDGPATAGMISRQYPLIRSVALSMKDDDMSIIGMLKAGCCAYLLKDIHPDELERALIEVHTKGLYNGDAANVNYRRLIASAQREEQLKLTERELTFLRLACSDMTYKQIAAQMYLSERTIDGYREAVFMKMNVQSRVGMVLEGLRAGLIFL